MQQLIIWCYQIRSLINLRRPLWEIQGLEFLTLHKATSLTEILKQSIAKDSLLQPLGHLHNQVTKQILSINLNLEESIWRTKRHWLSKVLRLSIERLTSKNIRINKVMKDTRSWRSFKIEMKERSLMLVKSKLKQSRKLGISRLTILEMV